MQELFAVLLLLPLLGNSVHVNNEFCSPRPTLVAIDNPNYKFFPYFVKLHRCGGSCDNVQPSVQSCVPLQYNEVPVTVQVIGTSATKVIMEKNHTRCGCECVISPDDCNLDLEDWRPDICQCKCKYTDTPPVPCGQGMNWSKNHCRCMCNKEPEQCGPNKVWSAKACGCVCKERRYRNCARRQKFVDEETCMCTDVMQGPETNQVSSPNPQQKGGFRQEFYVVIFLGQFVVMFLVFDAILYSKKAGLIYRFTRSCSTKGDLSNIENSREDIFSDSSVTCTAVTDLPTETGQNNMAATHV
ncbi:hypothetical protein ACROYT_G009370 [Oculina patagonica]